MIDVFRGKYSFLSNFYEIPIRYAGIEFGSTEAAFQAMKCKHFEERIRFENLNPSEAKRLGREIELREDWEEVKDQIMYDICKQKFSRNEDLKIKLIQTGQEPIIESNTWHDYYWGQCNGKGLNKLGKILMQIREELFEEVGGV